MTNAILIALIARYNSKAFTHNYIMGFTYNGKVYYVRQTGLSFGIKLDKASAKNGGGYSIRYNPTKAEKKALVESGTATMLCSVEFFNETVAGCKYNKGEVFEKMITELNGQQWEKDNVPFFKGADLTVNGTAFSLKFEKATICTESTLNKIGA